MSSTTFNSSQLMEYKRIAARTKCDAVGLKILRLRAEFKQLTVLLEAADDLKSSAVLGIMVNRVACDLRRSQEHFEVACNERVALEKEFADSIKGIPIFKAGGGYHYGDMW